jgi:hypothetical protein
MRRRYIGSRDRRFRVAGLDGWHEQPAASEHQASRNCSPLAPFKARQTDAVALSQRKSSAEAGLIRHASVIGSALGVPAGLIGVVAGGALGAAAGALLPEGAFDEDKSGRDSR